MITNKHSWSLETKLSGFAGRRTSNKGSEEFGSFICSHFSGDRLEIGAFGRGQAASQFTCGPTTLSFPSRLVTHFFDAPAKWPQHRAARVSKRSEQDIETSDSFFAFSFNCACSRARLCSENTLAYARASVFSHPGSIFIFYFPLSALPFCSSSVPPKAGENPRYSSLFLETEKNFRTGSAPVAGAMVAVPGTISRQITIPNRSAGRRAEHAGRVRSPDVRLLMVSSRRNR
jgi:hypothetical protein